MFLTVTRYEILRKRTRTWLGFFFPSVDVPLSPRCDTVPRSEVALIIVLTGHQTENDNAAALSVVITNVWSLVPRDLRLSRRNRLFILNNRLGPAGFPLEQREQTRRPGAPIPRPVRTQTQPAIPRDGIIDKMDRVGRFYDAIRSEH